MGPSRLFFQASFLIDAFNVLLTWEKLTILQARLVSPSRRSSGCPRLSRMPLGRRKEDTSCTPREQGRRRTWRSAPLRALSSYRPITEEPTARSSASLGAHRHRGTASPRHNGPGSFNRSKNYSTQCSNSPRISRAAAYLCVYAEFLLWNQFELETQYKLHVDILPNLGDAK